MKLYRLKLFFALFAVVFSFTTQAEPELVVKEFKQEKYLKSMDDKLVSSGRIYLYANKGIIWELDEPFKTKLILNKTKTLSLQGDEVLNLNTTTQEQGFLIANLGKIISNESANIRDVPGFKVESKENKNKITLMFTPTNEILEKFIKAVEVNLNKINVVEQVVIYRHNGNFDKIDFFMTKNYLKKDIGTLLSSKELKLLNDE